jgi:hypothetical protein
MDWSYLDENQILTCSQDKQVKVWNIQNPKVCIVTIVAGAPILKACFTVSNISILTL